MDDILDRHNILKKIDFNFQVTPIVAVLGPRQSGKTTCARQYLAKILDFPSQNYFDLEDSTDHTNLRDPLLALSGLHGLIVIDEIQQEQSLYPTLRVLVDREQNNQRYLILGSASPKLLKDSSETLAGRISYLELTPFCYGEILAGAKNANWEPLWLRGGFPRAFLATTDEISFAWRKNYIKTYLEQDIPRLGIRIPGENLRRFWMMLVHYQGALFNSSEIGRSLGLTNKTVQNYADILTETFLIRQLKPWYVNISKRQVKAPKIYIRDTGLLHTLLGISDMSQLLTHPKLGASWESFALEEIIRHYAADSDDCYFWATHQGAELDLLLLKDGKRLGFEFKYSSHPTMTKSLQIVGEDLELDELTVIYPGDKTYALTSEVQVKGLVAVLASEV